MSQVLVLCGHYLSPNNVPITRSHSGKWGGRKEHTQKVTFSPDITSVSWLLESLARCKVKGSLEIVAFCKIFWLEAACAPPRAPAMIAAAVIAIWRPIGWCWPDSPRAVGPPNCFLASLTLTHNLKKTIRFYCTNHKARKPKIEKTNQNLQPIQVHHDPERGKIVSNQIISDA